MNDRADSSRPGGALPAFAPAIGLREVLEAAPDLVFSCDAWGRFAWASAAFEPLAGHRASDLVGQSFLSLVVAEQRGHVARFFARQRKQGRPFAERELALTRRDGSSVRVCVRVRLYEAPDSEVYFVGIAREVSAWQDPVANAPADSVLQARVRELEAEIESAQSHAALKSELLATVSHEIRTPMNGLIGMASMLLSGELPPAHRHIVEIIHHSSQALMTLVNDTLDYSRLDAGRVSTECIDFDLRITLEQVGALLAPTADAKGIQFDARADSLVPSRLKGDPGRIRQVLFNLGGNAIKFTEKGNVAIKVEREHEDDDHVTLMFRVLDTGIGIAQDQVTQLFEAYTQADPSIARRFGGSGLGLAISRRLVQVMGGEVGVESIPDQGSTFWFRLTLEKQVQRLITPAPAEVQLRGVRVLVADGSASERRVTTEVLTAWGCECDEADNGMDALGRIRTAAAAGRPYDVALLNKQLEGLSGEELGTAIRADEALDPILLLLTTNVGRPGDAVRMRELGFSAYLLKPLDVSQLFDAFAEVTCAGHAQLAPLERPLVTRHTIAEAKRGRLRILLVEDDAVNQLVTQSALNRVGYSIEIASTGRMAIEMTESQRWDLILMDMQMPGLDGCRATEAIRARERGSHRTPILGLTGNAANGADRDRCLASGMDDVFGKPIDLAALTAAVERWTVRSESRTADTAPAAEPGTPKLTVISGRFDPPVRSLTAAISPDPLALPEIPEGPAIDLEQLNTSSMGLPALRTSLLHTYLGDVFPRLLRLEEALETSDTRRAEFEAHGLRGMCATIGAGGCSMLFGEIEQWAREELLADCRRLLPLAVSEVRRTEEFIHRLERIMLERAA